MAGCEARGRAHGRSFRPGATGEGKTGWVNVSEPSSDASLRQLPRSGCPTGMNRRLAVQVGGRRLGTLSGRVDTVASGVQRAPDPVTAILIFLSMPLSSPIISTARRRLVLPTRSRGLMVAISTRAWHADRNCLAPPSRCSRLIVWLLPRPSSLGVDHLDGAGMSLGQPRRTICWSLPTRRQGPLFLALTLTGCRARLLLREH
jgi:hypothetical protein